MAVSSVLNPEKIVGKQNKSFLAAQKFISGDNIIGSSVLNSAANKIVGFQRAGVKPVTPEINNIVSTISQNIVGNFDSQVQKIYQTVNQNLSKTSNELVQNYTTQVQRVEQAFNSDLNREIGSVSKKYELQFQNIYQSINNNVNRTLRSFSEDYRRRIQKTDEATPTGILEKFLNTYKSALGFAQYFGNKKNVDSLRDNLEALQKSFTESFEVAKLIRQVIIKIVNQLSNLPEASPSGGGGINVDVDIPGGGLKKTAPAGLSRMMKGRGKMLAMGAGVLGLGALGAGAVNALSDTGTLSSGVSSGVEPQVPEDMIDKFSSIVDRFSKAIDSLLRGAGTSKQQEPSPSGQRPSGASPSEKTSPSQSGPGGLSQEVTGAVSDPKVRAFLDVLAKPESGGAYNKVVGGGTFSDYSKHPEKYNAALGSDAAGRYQFLSTTFKPIAQRLGLKDFSPQSQDLAAVQYLKDLGVLDEIQSGDPKKIQSAIDRLKVSTWTGLKTYKQGEALKYYQERLSAGGKPAAPTLPPPAVSPQAQVAAAPTSAEARQQISQQVAQTPASQQNQQPIMMPIDLSGGAQQQPSGSTGGVSAPSSPSSGEGPTTPVLPSSNPDNFLVLYSKMVYNIVDG